MKKNILVIIMTLVCLLLLACNSQTENTSNPLSDTQARETDVNSTEEIDTVSSASPEEDDANQNNSEEATSDDQLIESAEEISDYKTIRTYFQAIAARDIYAYTGTFAPRFLLSLTDQEIDSINGLSAYANGTLFNGTYDIYRAKATDEDVQVLARFNQEEMTVLSFKVENKQISQLNIEPATSSDLNDFSDFTLESTDLLPDAYINYLRSVEEDNLHMFSKSFTENAEVIDVSRSFVGNEAITKWADREVMFLLYRVGRLTYSPDGVEVINHIRLSENSSGFYGSYKMTMVDNLINFADLQYSSLEDFNY
ncbi:hypothetical protein EZV73_16610 [Acidaminobacter sp. JC074]|uniref:hypothetical protein n=1 Tax=Acidaminobacter sp. JC074 TaxID=2530199 RepID=UPI001F1068C3|nr:hypothetical protein [Acidaminobacter sp. JC074]MCH4889220.1 hypothetical protein [Acidaminobacter sp. JC074]